jgi:DNA-binding NtrC family response regulator
MSVSSLEVYQKRTVLLVEDEKVIRELLAEVFEMEGFLVIAHENADEALFFLEQDSSGIALIVTDVNMPGDIDGAELANHSVEVWPWIPIIVMSGLNTLQTAGIKSDVAFIRKPFRVDDILCLVNKTLE